MTTGTATRVNDPVKARQYFEQKMQFTTGPVETERLIKQEGKNLQIIDVRAAEDFAKGHLPGAINLPEGKWTSPQGIVKEKQSVVYCYSHVCHLAARAALELAGQGYPVMEMEGGWKSWMKHELPVEK